MSALSRCNRDGVPGEARDERLHRLLPHVPLVAHAPPAGMIRAPTGHETAAPGAAGRAHVRCRNRAASWPANWTALVEVQ